MPRLKLTVLGVTLLAAACLLAWSMRAKPPVADSKQELQRIVSQLVAKHPSIRNCVLSIAGGDGRIAWSVAAGIAHERGHAPMTPDTPISVASVTKLFTATAVMLLAERKALSLDDPMAKYLPGTLIQGIHVYEGKDYSGEITIRELLSHRSGIADYYDEKAADGQSVSALLAKDPGRPWTVDETIARVRSQLKPHFAPDQGTYYSDTNFQLLGKIIESVTGKPLHLVFEALFFEPLGLEHTWLAGHPWNDFARSAVPADVFRGSENITASRSNPAYWADGGIVSTAADMIVFLKALNEGKIIRRETMQSMHSWHKTEFPLRYGLGTMYFDLPGPIGAMSGLLPLWGHSGSTGSFLYYCEELDLYMAGTIDQTESKVRPFILMRDAMNVVRASERR